ncbi:nuclease SbcCD subunit C [Luteitalea sp. TBR-22]|uniref:AAA family ATPase n=1 Tax=Luteitalea sp. TBR-22 TaxID=2802971 RepID=UPI001AF11CD5|nr:SMC family ATPase [Luteitalea sp. TBR-22]BCS35952.1 nuclease SbcCD subunit C [Luteitalea sp. TBR-22]
MKPLSLEVNGFTCFRDPQEKLDLSGLSLFAITGPTGAGKSSVLDAITFALYGEVPRVGRAQMKELISHGRDRMTVTLRFAVGARTFVVSRTVRRTNTAGTCQLDEIVDGRATPVAANSTAVKDAVQRIVGLDYDAFTHAVILPQGEFARFLKGAPAQRRQILQDLLRLGVYGRMRQLARERCAQAQAELDAAQRQLDACADATPEAIAASELELAAAQARQPQLVEARALAQAARVLAEARAALAGDLAVRRAERDALRESEPQQVARLERIARSRRAQAIEAELAQHARDEAVHRERTEAREKAAGRLAAAQQAATRARARLAEAERAVAALAPAREKAEKLQALEGRLQHAEALAAECETLTRERVARAAELEDRLREQVERSTALEQVTADVARLDRQLSAVTFDPAELAACEQWRDVARELRSARQQGPDAEAQASRARADLAEDERIAAAEATALEEARAALTRAEARRAEVARQLTAAQDAHRAMTLRSHLHAGDACPVCTQLVAEVPPVEHAPEFTALLDAQNEAADACVTLGQRVEKQRERQVKAAAAVEGARARLAAAEQQQRALRERVASTIATLASRLAPYLPASRAAMPEHWLLERLDDLQALRAEREGRERQRQILETSRLAAEHRVALTAQAIASTQQALAALSTQLGQKQARLDEQRAEIRQATDAADPRAELADLRARILDVEGAHDAARVAASREETTLAGATEADAAAARALEQAALALQAVTARITGTLAASGFASIAEAASALLTPADLGELEDQAAAHARRVAAVDAQLAEIEARLGSEPVRDDDVARCLEAEREADEAVQGHVRHVAMLEVRLQGLRARALEAVAAQSQVAAARQGVDTYTRLSSDLKADAFQAWLLREYFERLVLGASTRLMELSGRYTLQWIDDEFVVVDHDNAQERRAADTLSGGETFLASLALALELSEQVQRAAGAVRLDSLFIDEGFGTLDAAAQDVVASAIESLQVSGRMVGIITHVRELTDRMPTCVVIEKRPDGSRWSIR